MAEKGEKSTLPALIGRKKPLVQGSPIAKGQDCLGNPKGDAQEGAGTAQ